VGGFILCVLDFFVGDLCPPRRANFRLTQKDGASSLSTTASRFLDSASRLSATSNSSMLSIKVTVTAHTKDKVSLSDFEGQKVILWFYPRASTGG
jgi:hypothetical protein